MVENEYRYHAFFNLAAVGAAQVEPQAERFLDVNSRFRETVGYTKNELVGMTLGDILHPEDREANLAGFRNLFLGESTFFENETRFVRNDGKVIWARIAATLIRNSSGVPLQMAVLVADITERKLADEERENLIAELQRALDDVQVLSKLLPICAWCKKVRDDKGYWEQIEHYFETHSHLQFTHGICPECIEKHHSRRR
jgi:PAS domain S-box-containing protein